MSKTNKQQYKKLYDALSRKPDIPEGYDINLLGHPVKDAATWRKVWLDWKAYIKRKLTVNQIKHNATGGGEYKKQTFSMLEEGVIQLTGLQVSTAGIRGTSSYCVNSHRPAQNYRYSISKVLV